MIYKHKETNNYVEMVTSGNTWVGVIELLQNGELYDETQGKVFKGNKRQFKKFFKKVKEHKVKELKLNLPPERMKLEVKEQLENIFKYN